MSDQLRRSINVETRVLSKEKGIVEYIASDASLDSYDESILPTGWRFSFFQKNAPFVDSHKYHCIEFLLGRVTSARIENNQLIEAVEWAKDIQESKLAQLGWKLTLGGFLKAVSVGFRTVKAAYPNDTAWTSLVAQSGMTPDQAARCRRIFIEQEQLELSACILGANPAAVAKAHDQGCINDGDLASVGFNDDDMQFLKVAGKALADPKGGEVERLLIEREMKRISSRNNLKSEREKTNSPSSINLAGDEEARQREVQQREDFLRKFGALLPK